MNQILRLNNVVLKDITSYYSFFNKQIPGIKKYTMFKFIKRFEYNILRESFNLKEYKEFSFFFLTFFFEIFPKNLSILNKQLVQIIFLTIT